jgi:hypothetical protein
MPSPRSYARNHGITAGFDETLAIDRIIQKLLIISMTPNLRLFASAVLLALLSFQTAQAEQLEAKIEINDEGVITITGNNSISAAKELADGSIRMPVDKKESFPDRVTFIGKHGVKLTCVFRTWLVKHPYAFQKGPGDLDHIYTTTVFRGVSKGENNVLQIEDQCGIGYYFYYACEAQKHMKSDPEEAVKWFLRAAKHGHADAQFFLGTCLSAGKGIDKNTSEAAKWFLKSAEQGNSNAQYMLGFAYVTGNGVPKDEIEAYAFFNLAAASDESCRKELSRLESQISPDARLAGQQRSKQLLKEFESKKESLQRLLEEAKKDQDKKGA